MKNITLPTLLSLVILNIPVSTLAADSVTWTGYATAEREHDSSVSLEQVDDVSRESDYANQLKWGLGAKWQATDSLQFSTQYLGKHKDYDEFTEYDLNQHHLALSSKFTYSGIGYGYRFDGVKAKVDGEDFLNFSQSTLALDKLSDSSFYMRAAISINKKDFIQLDERDAQATVFGLDSMAFSTSGRSHVSVNASVKNEVAEEKLFDNKTLSLKVSFQHKFASTHFPTTFVTGIRYAHKAYDSFDITFANNSGGILTGFQPQNSIDETRVDLLKQWTTSLDVGLNDWLGLILKVTYADNDSNYDAVKYDERIISAGLSARF